jgi:hypothetical protein
MENNEEIEETQEQDVQPEENEQETTPESEEQEGAEDTTDWKAEALKQKAIAKRLDKKLQSKEPINKTNNELTRDEIRLIAEKVSDDKIVLLKQIQAGIKASSGEDISLVDAMQNPMYVALVEKEEAKARAEKAQLGASGNAGIHTDTKFASGQSKEDHQAEWRKAMENL